MEKLTKIRIGGWLLFGVPLIIQIVNIIVAAGRPLGSSARMEFGTWVFWCQILIYPQIVGIVMLMYAQWVKRGRPQR